MGDVPSEGERRAQTGAAPQRRRGEFPMVPVYWPTFPHMQPPPLCRPAWRSFHKHKWQEKYFTGAGIEQLPATQALPEPRNSSLIRSFQEGLGFSHCQATLPSTNQLRVGSALELVTQSEGVASWSGAEAQAVLKSSTVVLVRADSNAAEDRLFNLKPREPLNHLHSPSPRYPMTLKGALETHQERRVKAKGCKKVKNVTSDP